MTLPGIVTFWAGLVHDALVHPGVSMQPFVAKNISSFPLEAPSSCILQLLGRVLVSMYWVAWQGCAARFLHEVAESGQRLASLLLFFLSLSLGDRGGVAIKSAQWLTMPHI